MPSVLEEVEWLHERGVIEPCNSKNRVKKAVRLDYLMFLKRNDAISVNREDSQSARVAVKELIQSCIIVITNLRCIAFKNYYCSFVLS